MPQLILAFLAFAAVVAVADTLGWGSGPRGIVFMLLGFLFAASWFDRKGWDRIFFLMCLGSFFISLVVIHQAFLVPRPFGPFRSANILGGYAAMHFGIACLARYRRTSAWNEAEIWFYIITALLNALTVVLSQSRGAMLALLAAILVINFGRPKTYFGQSIWHFGRHFGRYPKIVSVVAVAVVSAVVCWTLQRGFDDPRLAIWRTGLAAGMNKPWLGWGQGGLTIGFNGLQSLYNVALEWFAAAGAVGLAAGLWLYGAACHAALRLKDKAAGRAALAVLAAFFVQGMFMFGTAATYLPLVTVLAWLASEQWSLEKRNVAQGASRVHDHQPLLNGRTGTNRAD